MSFNEYQITLTQISSKSCLHPNLVGGKSHLSLVLWREIVAREEYSAEKRRRTVGAEGGHKN